MIEKAGLVPREGAQSHPAGSRPCIRRGRFERVFRALTILCRLLACARDAGAARRAGAARISRRMPPSRQDSRASLGTAKTKDNASAARRQRLARALESLGPAHIKLGQVLATRPDLIGDDIARALETCRTACRRSRRRGASRRRNANSASLLDTMFSRLRSSRSRPPPSRRCTRPTTTDDPPRRVAVKVLRPGIEADFARDLSRPCGSPRDWPSASRPKRAVCACARGRDAGGLRGAGARSAHGRRRRRRSWRRTREATPISVCRRRLDRARRSAC